MVFTKLESRSNLLILNLKWDGAEEPTIHNFYKINNMLFKVHIQT